MPLGRAAFRSGAGQSVGKAHNFAGKSSIPKCPAHSFGKQFGNITIEQYLHLAQQLRDSTPGRHILISKRADGGGSKFDLKRGWFVAFDGDGTLRTFFVPKDGVRFFEAQQKSNAPPE